MNEPLPPNIRETLKTPATVDPFTASELRAFARLDDFGDDSVLTDAIKAAVRFVESNLGRAIRTQTWNVTIEDMFPLDGFKPSVEPFQSVTSIVTRRADSDDQTWTTDQYLVKPGNVIVAISNAPDNLGQNDWIKIDYVTGWTSNDDIPPDLMQSMMIVAHEFYVFNRDVGGMPTRLWPGDSWALAEPYMVYRGM